MQNVYDFDKTIYCGDSSIDFLIYCLKKNFSCLQVLPIILFFGFLYLISFIELKKFKEKFFSFLSKIENVDSYINEFWLFHESKIRTWYLRNRQPQDVVISASPEFLIFPICKKIGIKYVIASKIDKTSGRLYGENCKGAEKVRRLKEKYPQCKISSFYSNTLTDKPLAHLSSKAYIVKGNQLVPWDEYHEPVLEKLFKTFLSPQFFTFIFCGAIGTIVNFFLSLYFSKVYDPIFSYIFAYGISIMVTYFLNAKINFKKKLSFVDFIRFVISYIPNFCILLSFVFVFLKLLFWNKILVYAFAGLLGLPITYLIVQLFVFLHSAHDE